jgi:hypothetical protein
VLFCCAIAGCATSGDSDTIATTFDPCSPLDLSAAMPTPVQADGIAAAIAAWKADGAPGLGVAAGASLDVRFQSAAPLFYGLYDDTNAVIYINNDLTDAGTLAVVVAHELGHAFGLHHVSTDVRASVMNPGNLTVMPTDEDRRTLEALRGACVGGS